MQGLKSGDAGERERSWAALVEAYWKPAYKHLRLKWRQTPEAAADTVQGFFAKALERDFFSGYEPSRAKFRTYFRLLLDRHQSKAQRGVLQVDFAEAEAELQRTGPEDPETAFEREWRRHLFGRAIDALKSELEPVVFRIFEQYDLCDPPRPRYEDLANEHGLPLTTVTNHLAKARRELRARVQALASAVDEEL